MKKYISSLFVAAAVFTATPAVAQHLDDPLAVATRIHNDANKRIRYRDDTQGDKIVDVWSMPDKYGDCEDIALYKRQRLIEAGFDSDDIMILIVRKNTGYEAQQSNKRVTYLHVIVYIRSLDVVLDIKNDNLINGEDGSHYGVRSSRVPVVSYDTWMAQKNGSLYCVAQDISLGQMSVKQRCGDTTLTRIARKD